MSGKLWLLLLFLSLLVPSLTLMLEGMKKVPVRHPTSDTLPGMVNCAGFWVSAMATTQTDRAGSPRGLGGEGRSWEAEATPPGSLRLPPPNRGSGPAGSDLSALKPEVLTPKGGLKIYFKNEGQWSGSRHILRGQNGPTF